MNGGVYWGATESNTLFGIENIIGTDFADLLVGRSGSAAVINGGDGNDRLYGGIQGDTLSGGLGNDYSFCGDGIDLIYDDLGDDFINGGPSFDTIDFSRHTTGVYVDLDGNVAYAGGSLNGGGVYSGATETNTVFGVESLIGTSFGDRLEAKSGSAATIQGGDGNDWIYGGIQTDHLYGGLGDDFVVGNGGNDQIYDDLGDDYMNGGAGIDTVDFSLRNGGVSVDLDNHSALAGGLLDANGVYSGANETNSLYGFEKVIGSDHADLLVGTNGTATRIYGESGDDWLHGGSKTDTLSGGTGNDTIFLGGGGDKVVYALGDGSDIVHGFGSIDLVQLDNLDTVFATTQDAYSALQTVSGGVGLDFGNGDTITFLGTQLADFSSASFELI